MERRREPASRDAGREPLLICHRLGGCGRAYGICAGRDGLVKDIIDGKRGKEVGEGSRVDMVRRAGVRKVRILVADLPAWVCFLGAELCCGSVRCSYNDGREGRISCLYPEFISLVRYRYFTRRVLFFRPFMVVQSSQSGFTLDVGRGSGTAQSGRIYRTSSSCSFGGRDIRMTNVYENLTEISFRDVPFMSLEE